MSSSFSLVAFRLEMEGNLGPSPNDPNRCITDCKVWPKGVEPPDCYCQMRCVPNISRDYETFWPEILVLQEYRGSPKKRCNITGID